MAMLKIDDPILHFLRHDMRQKRLAMLSGHVEKPGRDDQNHHGETCRHIDLAQQMELPGP